MYGTARHALVGIGVLLLGIIVGGGGHVVVSLISHAGRLAFDFPLFLVGVGVGLAIGLWLGGDRALHKLGEFEHAQRWERIRK